MSVGQEFWIVAAGCSQGAEKESLLAALKRQQSLIPKAVASRAGQTTGQFDCPWKFDVPDGERSLLFGSFDNLIRLTDDLQKCDGQLDGILHRLERQYLELDPRAEFKVKSQRQERPFLEYLRTWQWDEAKYPKTRSISDNLTLLMSVVNKLDEEARNKTAQYNEFKTQKSNLAKKDANANLLSKDLVDVLTPDVVKANSSADDDFIMTEHLATVCVILVRGSEEEFLRSYETLSENIVPMSARKFDVDDKDGNSLWRVVMFKSAVEGFKKVCRDKRIVARDFEYSEEGYKKLKQQREQVEEALKRQHELVRGLYQAAWSDAMVAWMHIKAMRVFVESVLRFGMPPRFAAFVVSPKSNALGAARKALTEILGKVGSAGPYGDKMSEGQEDGGEEFFPYVSLSFTPFTIARS